MLQARPKPPRVRPCSHDKRCFRGAKAVPDYSLAIARDDLADILRMAASGVRSSGPAFKVRLEFSSGELSATGPGAGADAPAEGNWPGAVLIAGEVARRLASRLPAVDPFVVTISGQALRIGGLTLPVEVLGAAPPVVEVTFGASHREVLVAVVRHGRAPVVASLGEEAVQEAHEAAGRAIKSAIQTLKQFGVEAEEVAEALRAALRRQARGLEGS